jgi:hypothetical protein
VSRHVTSTHALARGGRLGRRQRRGRKLARLHLRLKYDRLVAAVAKGFRRGMTATAQADADPTPEPEFIAILIADSEFALDAQRTVIANRDFSQIVLLLLEPASRRSQARP